MDRKCNPEAGSSKPPLLLYQSESGAREHFFSPCPRLGRPALGPQASQHMVSVKSAKSRLRKDVSRQGFGSSVRALAGNVVTSSARTTSSTAGCGGLCSKGAAACKQDVMITEQTVYTAPKPIVSPSKSERPNLPHRKSALFYL